MIVVDVETTGTEPSIHSLLSIGAIDFEDSKNTFYGECRIWDGAHIDKEALKINGFTEDAAVDKSKQQERELVWSFMLWAEKIEDKTIAGQNPSFDREFLRASAKRAGFKFDFAHRVVDLHSIAFADMRRKGLQVPIKNNHSALNLDKIAEYVGMSINRGAHNALEDAEIEAKCFRKLI